jgi:hypothetical protein
MGSHATIPLQRPSSVFCATSGLFKAGSAINPEMKCQIWKWYHKKMGTRSFILLKPIMSSQPSTCCSISISIYNAEQGVSLNCTLSLLILYWFDTYNAIIDHQILPTHQPTTAKTCLSTYGKWGKWRLSRGWYCTNAKLELTGKLQNQARWSSLPLLLPFVYRLICKCAHFIQL